MSGQHGPVIWVQIHLHFGLNQNARTYLVYPRPILMVRPPSKSSKSSLFRSYVAKCRASSKNGVSIMVPPMFSERFGPPVDTASSGRRRSCPTATLTTSLPLSRGPRRKPSKGGLRGLRGFFKASPRKKRNGSSRGRRNRPVCRLSATRRTEDAMFVCVGLSGLGLYLAATYAKYIIAISE